MCEFIIDTDNAFNDFDVMIKSGEAKLLSLEKNVAKVIINKKLIKVELGATYINRFNNIDRIIYGKDNTKNIVNISIKDDTVFLFKEINGKVSYDTLPYKHWVLSSNAQEGFYPLKGSQHFKFIKEYTSLAEFNRVKYNIYKLGMYTLSNYPEAFMIRNGHTYFKDMKVQDVSALSFDIETTGLDPNADDAEVLLITNTFRKNGILKKKTFNLHNYKRQVDMIIDWSNWVQEIDPSIILGHNIIIFDLPYIKTIMDNNNAPLHLGRHRELLTIDDKTKELRVDGTQTYTYKRINIFGREIIDTFFLAIKADIAKKYTSYGLKNIVKQEDLEKIDRTFVDASRIKFYYANRHNDPKMWNKVVAYAEDDSDDSLKLFDIMIASFFYLTPHIPKPFQMMIESATGSQINSLMVRSYLQDGFSVARADEIKSFEGAISFGNPGIFNNVFKVDVASLYPSIMRHYKIFPKGKDFNGNFLRALEYFTIERLKNKKLAKETGDRYYKDLEQAQKVVINSAYGFMGASGLNYNFGEGASETTRYGREIITKAVEWATGNTLVKVIKHIRNEGKENEEKEYEWRIIDDAPVCEGKGFTISNCDTDSISFTVGKEISSEEKILLLNELNSLYPSAIRFEDDGFFKRVIILKAKNYILWDGKKIKLKGSSLRDQKKEPALKEMLNEMIDSLVHDKASLLDIYHKYIKECLDIKNIARWATKKSVSKAILKCAKDPEARLNERKVYDAIKDIKVQEGDKVHLYPAILFEHSEFTQLKNGKIKEKKHKETGLKRIDIWNKDHDVEKLIERVYSTIEILSGVLNMEEFIDYTLVKNKVLLDNIK